MHNFYEKLTALKQTNRCQLAVLIDPDKQTESSLLRLMEHCVRAEIEQLLVGGSLVSTDWMRGMVKTIKQCCDIPVALFPGGIAQVVPEADAILLLSLISGRNPEYLIGQHIQAAPMLKRSGLEIVPTSYLLIDGGKPTTVQYISNTMPIPADKPDVAAVTAMAGEQLGQLITYLDAGSGAQNPVPVDVIEAVRKATDNPIIVGGGIRTPGQAWERAQAGANMLVIGNALEKEPSLLKELATAVKEGLA